MTGKLGRPIWVLNLLAGILSSLVALSLPSVFFALSYQNQAGALDTEAEINARIISDVIKINPEMWMYEEVRLVELLSRRPGKRFPETRRILNARNEEIARSDQALDPPTFSRSENLVDAGAVVGRIEITRSLRPLLVRTAEVLLAGLLLGGAIFMVLRSIPLKALRRALDALSREKERAHVALRSIGDGVITTDLSGRVDSINGVAENITGWKEEEARGKPLKEVFRIVDGGTRERCPDLVEIVMRELRSVGMSESAMRVIQVSRDGVERLVEGTVSPIFESGRKFVGAVLVFRDVTGKVREEQELIKRRELESLGILAGGIAHDFNNFLSGILGNISLAKLTVDTGNKAYARLEGAEKASLGAKTLATKLLAFAKGGKPLRKPMSIERILRDSSGFALMGSNCRCEFHIQEGLWPVVADTAQIGQVVGNLVVNAVHAMSGGGTIRIHAENAAVGEGDVLHVKAGDFVKVEVVDQGIGIPKENIQKIFDPYFTTKEKGTGLGLATSYAIMKGHGGNIFVESETGAGTTFRLYLPAVRDYISAEAKNIQGTVVKGKGRVLVMDDERLILDVSAGMLEHLGYESVQANDGARAIEKYCKAVDSGEPFDAVIMDLTIAGGMGGKEAAARLLELHPDAKVIVSSGYSDDPVMAEFAKHGFRGVVAKPYRIEDLSRVLDEVIGGRTQQPG